MNDVALLSIGAGARARAPIPTYAFWGMLVLTILSYLCHRERRKTRVGNPIELSEA